MKRLFCLWIALFPLFTVAQSHIESGDVGMYDTDFLGQPTSSGESYDPNLLTAGHRFLPIGTMITVVNPANQKSVQVRIIDQVLTRNYVIYLSAAATKALMPLGNLVSLYTVQSAPLSSRSAVAASTYQPQPTQPVQPQPQFVQPAQPVQPQPTQVLQPAQPVQPQPTQVLQPAQPVQPQPTQVTQPAQPVQPQPTQVLQPTQPVQPQVVQPSQPVQPVATTPQPVVPSSSRQQVAPMGYAPDRVFQSGEIAFQPNVARGNMANGQPYNPNQLTAAHLFLPFGTRVKVENPATGKSVVVQITDRGPFGHPGRVLDMSYKAAADLGIVSNGKIQGKVYVLDAIGAHYYNLPQNFEAWTLQISSTSILETAKATVQRLGTDGFYSPQTVNGNLLYRVYYGRYTSKTEAQAQIPALQSRGFATATPRSMLLELNQFIDFSAFGGPNGRQP